MAPEVIAAIIGGISTVLAAIIAYMAAKSKLSKTTDLVFETTDYVKHLRKHNLPIKGIRDAFVYSTSVEELSENLKKLSNNPITCEYFKPKKMKRKFLTPINNARSAVNAKEFNELGEVPN